MQILEFTLSYAHLPVSPYYLVMLVAYLFLMYHIIYFNKNILSPLIILVISSEFDRFLAERAKAAERLPSLRSSSQDNEYAKS